MTTADQSAKTSSRNIFGVFIVSIVLVFIGIFGLFLAQQQIQMPQETLTRATNPSGQAFLTTSPQGGSSFAINQEAKIDLNLNTAGIQANSVELVFSVLTETTDNLVVQSYSNTNLEITQQEIEQIEGGLLVVYKARPINGTFSSNDNLRILSLLFTPTRTGEFQLAFDNEESRVTRNDNNTDFLRPIPTATFSITSTASGPVKSCNESCGSNAECAVNHRCYEGRCRLVTNPTSTSCVNPPDQGLNRQCNQYCADTNECASGYSCFFNRCRRPENPDSVTCGVTSTTQQQQMAASCNRSCNTNADCAVNLRCYQGSCRLATNVSSLTCSAVTKPTVSSIYGGDETKGGITPTPAPGVATSSATPRPSTDSATATGSGVATPRPTSTPPVQPVVSPAPTAAPESGISSFTARLGVMLPMLALIGGAILLLIVMISMIIGISKRRKGPSSVTVTKSGSYEQELQAKINALQAQSPAPTSSVPPTPVQPTPPATFKPVPPPPEPPVPVIPSASGVPTSTLKLQTSPVAPRPQAGPTVPSAAAMPTTRPTPVHPVMPVRPTWSSTPPSSVAPTAPIPPTKPPAAPTTPNSMTPSPTASSMLDRMKQKGITAPGQNGSEPS